MTVKMVATEKCPPRHGTPGAEINVSNSCVKAFKSMGWAVTTDEVKQVRERQAMESLSAEYERLTGRKPDNRWKTETLQRKVEDERRTYQRRDMRAED